eukprot:Skav206329  [mRNA]  locus=scaffold1420:254029:254826:- [translate_table: standard]
MGTFDSARGYIGTHMEEYANRHRGKAACCLPILCEAWDVIDVQNKETAAAYMPPNENGRCRPREAGKDQWGEVQPAWRDVHVVTIYGKDPGAETLGVQHLSLAVNKIRHLRQQRAPQRGGRDIIARVRQGSTLFNARGGENLPKHWERPAFTEVEGGAHGWLREDGRLGLLPGHYRVIGGAGTRSGLPIALMALFIGDRCVAEGMSLGLDSNASPLTGSVFEVNVEANLEIRLQLREKVGFLSWQPLEFDGRRVIEAFIHLERLE